METLRIIAAATMLALAGTTPAQSPDVLDDDTTIAANLTAARGKLVGRDLDAVTTAEMVVLLDAVKLRQQEILPKAAKLQGQLDELHRAEQECQFMLDYMGKRTRRAVKKP